MPWASGWQEGGDGVLPIMRTEENALEIDSGHIGVSLEPVLQGILTSLKVLELNQQEQFEDLFDAMQKLSNGERLSADIRSVKKVPPAVENNVHIASEKQSDELAQRSAVQNVGFEGAVQVDTDVHTVGTPAPSESRSGGTSGISIGRHGSSFISLVKKLNRTKTMEKQIPLSRVDYWKAAARKAVHGVHFEYLIGFVIFMNTFTIGFRITAELDGKDDAFYIILENIYLVIYIIELMLRFFGDGVIESLKKTWVIFDIALISIATLSLWVLEPIYSCTDAGCDDQFVRRLKPVMVFRVFRLLRLLQALRLLSHFNTLWRLVQGLLHSLGTMCWTLLLVTLTLYVFACCAVELITKDPWLNQDPTLRKTIKKQFADIPTSMLSLMQFVTMDSVSSLYWDLIMKQPLFIVYFVVVLLVISITLMNLVTAILVENSIANAGMDAEMKKAHYAKTIKALIPEIKATFAMIDKSGDGYCSLNELLAQYHKLPALILDHFSPERLVEVFELLDVDSSGTIDQREFVEGILQLTLSEASIETKQTTKTLRLLKDKLENLVQMVAQIQNEKTPSFSMSFDASTKQPSITPTFRQVSANSRISSTASASKRMLLV